MSRNDVQIQFSSISYTLKRQHSACPTIKGKSIKQSLMVIPQTAVTLDGISE